MDDLNVDAKAMGLRIREARLASGYSKRSKFARKVGIEPKTARRLERGDNIASLPVAVAIARALGVRVEWLTSGEEPREQSSEAAS